MIGLMHLMRKPEHGLIKQLLFLHFRDALKIIEIFPKHQVSVNIIAFTILVLH
jgi:hypothetical protein